MHLYVYKQAFYKCICRVWFMHSFLRNTTLTNKSCLHKSAFFLARLSLGAGYLFIAQLEYIWNLPERAALFRRSQVLPISARTQRFRGNQSDISCSALLHPSILYRKQESFNSRGIQAWLSSELRHHQQGKHFPPLGYDSSTWSSSSSSR